jgi:hypothetical protein
MVVQATNFFQDFAISTQGADVPRHAMQAGYAPVRLIRTGNIYRSLIPKHQCRWFSYGRTIELIL